MNLGSLLPCAGLLVVTFSVGCGDVKGPAGPDAADRPDAAPPVDASPVDAPAPRCSLTAPFGAPTEITSVNSPASEWSARPSADELEMYIGSDRDGSYNDLFVARRASTAEPFGAATSLTPINTPFGHEGVPAITGDGLTLYFHSDRDGVPLKWDLFTATRPSAAAPFGAPVRVPNVNSAASDWEPWVSADGATLYFGSDRNGGGPNWGDDGAIFRATRGMNGVFAAPVALLALGPSGNPVLTPDQLTIYFMRDGDIFEAHRATTNDGFGPPRAVPELATAGHDAPMWVSADGCALHFISDGRAGATGRLDAFVTMRGR